MDLRKLETEPVRARIGARDAAVLKNMVASFVLKGGSLVVGLLTVPAYIRFFDDQQVLGVWFTLIATLSWILNFDVGIGNGARNRLAEALSVRDVSRAKEVISSTYGATLGIVVLVSALTLIGVVSVDWNVVFNIPVEVVDAMTLRTSVGVILGGLLLQLWLRTISSVLYALQASAVVSLLSLVSSSVLLAYAWWATVPSGADGLGALARVYLVAVNAPLLLATLVIFGTVLRAYWPDPRWCRWSVVKDVMSLGSQFFVLQLLGMLLANVNPFLISWLSDPKYVVEFQIYARAFSALSSVFILALTPIWSAVTQAVASGDLSWVRRTYLRLNRALVVLLGGLAILIPFMQLLVDLWLGGHAVKVNWSVSVVFALSAGAFAWSGALASIANGMGAVRSQSLSLGLGVLLKALFAYFVVRATGAWIWIVVSDLVGLLPYLVLQPALLRRLLVDGAVRAPRVQGGAQ